MNPWFHHNYTCTESIQSILCASDLLARAPSACASDSVCWQAACPQRWVSQSEMNSDQLYHLFFKWDNPPLLPFVNTLQSSQVATHLTDSQNVCSPVHDKGGLVMVTNTTSNIITLAKAKHHIPLLLFTSASTDKLWKNSASLSMKKITTISGTKAMILNLMQFPDEDDISISEFHEPSWISGTIRWSWISSTFKFALQIPSYLTHFTQNFQAIKTFDKEQCQEASYDLHTCNEDQYLMCFE